MGIRGLAILSCLAVASVAYAQNATTGGIYGVVTDEKSNALAGVTVIVTSEGNVAQTALTEGDGSYKMSDLAPGEYLVTFYFADTTIERKVTVGVQKVTPVYQKINTATVGGEVIKIEGKTPTIDPTSTSQGITIDKNYLQNIPVPGRTFEAALGAAAGSQGDIGGVAFSGSSSLENQYYVDGVNTTGLTFGTVGSPVINDFIEEIEIITGGYNAEYGRATGGIVNVVTKSGSNELKGSVFGYWQPGLLTAAAERTPFNAGSIDVKADVGYRADLGFEIGGPIIKDKLWYFIGFAPAFTRTDYTRDTKRQTDCHKLLDTGKLSDCKPVLPTGDQGYADGTPDVDPSTGFFITDRLDTEVRSATTQAYNTLGKINYALTPEQQGQVSIQLQPGSARNPGLYGVASSGDKQSFDALDVGGKWTSKLNDNKTELEAFFGYHRETFENHALESDLEQQPLQILRDGNLGIWGPGFGESQVTNAGCFDSRMPGNSDPYPFITNCPMATRTYSIGGPGSLYTDKDERIAGRLGVTQRVKAAGTHEIKAGIDFENNLSQHTRAFSGGAYLVNSVGTAVDVVRWVQLAGKDSTDPRFDQTCYTPAPPTSPDPTATSYKCDYVSGVPGRPGTLVEGNTLNYSAFMRDSWQVRPNVTVDAGVRVESQRLRYADFLQNTIHPVTGDRLGTNALALPLEIAPRIGATYDWTREGRSKVYGHWGRFYESIPMAINDVSFGMPVEYIQTYTPKVCDIPGVTMDDPRIGGRNGVNCLNTTAQADQRQQLFGENGSIVAPGVKGQYLDEIVGGIEYELIEDLKLGVSLQDRRLGRVIEDVSLDGANSYIITNPGEWSKDDEKDFQKKVKAEQDPARKKRLMNLLEQYRGIRIFDKPRRNYDALQFTLVRRFSKQLYLQASYTYSRTEGNYPGLINSDDNIVIPNASTQYDLIELLANRIGPLPQDRPHYIKVDSYYTWDLKKNGAITTGIRFRALSGIPRNALAAHYLYGDDQSFLLPRGSIGRTDFEHGLDVHIGYKRALPRHTFGELFVDFYNIYNDQGTFAVDNSYAGFIKQGSPDGIGTIQAANPVSGGTYDDLIWVKTIDRNGVESSSPIGRNPNFGHTTQRYSPFYVRFGARLTF